MGDTTNKQVQVMGERIKLLREEKRWTLAQLGEFIDKADSTVNRYEKGTRQPDPVVLVKLADLLECSLDYLTGRSDERFCQTRESSQDNDEATMDFSQLEDHTKKLPPHAQKQLQDIISTYLKAFSKDEKS